MTTEYIINVMDHTRRHFLELTADCTPEEMNAMPKGFNNNLIWNLGHVIASQQMLCYEMSNLELRITKKHMDAYKPTTRPEGFIDQQGIDEIRKLAKTTIDQLADDYRSGLFETYQGRQTKYGPLLSNIDEAIAYVSTHETLHFGYAKALLKLLRS